MPGEKYLAEANLLATRDLQEQASIAVLRNIRAQIPGVEHWGEGGLKKTPFTIYDINGQPLFHDFTIQKGTQALGTVRTAASKILGTPVVSTELGPQNWDYAAAVKKLTPLVKKQYKAAKILRAVPVCYSYPKIGVMFEMMSALKRPMRAIYDVADFTKISEKPDRPNIEGAYAWSLYDSIPEVVRKRALKEFDVLDKLRLKFPVKTRDKWIAAKNLKAFIPDFKVLKFKFNLTRLLQFCPHYAYTEARSHHCFVLHGQQKNDYCAVATAQMILCYYRYYYTQDQIAPQLGYHAGGCPADQSPGYKTLSCNQLNSSFDNAPTWEKGRDQINALHPFKSGISGHARACAGYSYIWELFSGIKEKSLYIYDPWPWNADYKLAGAIKWENWTSINHTNYVYTSQKCP